MASATVDKEVAQKGARLLRFGDPVFEAMVAHVQHRIFSAVASLDFPAEQLGWPRQAQGTWILFELQVARTEGKKSLVLRRELASFLVPVSGDKAESRPELIKLVNGSTQGPPRPDVVEAQRAFNIGRGAAEKQLQALLDEVLAENLGDSAIAPTPVSDFALAWVRAV